MNHAYLTRPPLAKWLDSFELGETRYIEVSSQDDSNNLVRQIQAKSRRKERTKRWRFVCTTHLALDVSNPLSQKLLLEVFAMNDGVPKNFTI